MSKKEFFHFLSKEPNKNEKILIHLEHSVFDPNVVHELEEIISVAIKNGTWKRTTIVPPSPISINLETGKADPMESKISLDILAKLINLVVQNLSDDNNE